MDSQLTANLVDAKLVHVEENLRERDENLRDLHSFFTRDTLRLSATPSIAPTRTRLVTSGFGVRVDPFTEEEVMHKGVDFAGELGDDVVSTGMVRSSSWVSAAGMVNLSWLIMASATRVIMHI